MIGKILTYAAGLWAMILVGIVVTQGVPIQEALSNMLSPGMILFSLGFGVLSIFFDMF